MAIALNKIKFFVEGNADQVLMKDILKMLYGIEVTPPQLKELIVICGGYDGIIKQRDEFLQIRAGEKRENGKNIVLFDADYTGTGDAHGFKAKTEYLEQIKRDLEIGFEYFLFPNNGTDGTIETLLESCINPENSSILECWKGFEECVSSNPSYTIPADKSKIYVYLECLHGTTKSEKEKIKDPKRDFTIPRLWHFDFENNIFLKDFKTFLDKHLVSS